MAWATTLVIVDSAVPTFKIQGASVCDGFGGCGVTDANGQLIYVVLDDSFSQYFVRITKSSATMHAAFGYLPKNYILNKSSSSMIQTVQLQAAPDPGTGTGSTPAPSCFIVTAVTGSEESEEVMHLRMLRDRVAARSNLSKLLIDRIYVDYAEFSPAIASKLHEDTVARAAVLWLVVRPLLSWYAAAGMCAMEEVDTCTLAEMEERVRIYCPAYSGGESIIAILEKVRSGEEISADAQSMLLDLAAHVQKAARMEFASWAILDPLIRTWRVALEGRDLKEEIAQWLSTAPLDRLEVSGDSINRSDLEELSRFFEFQPRARTELGKRLAAAWPEAMQNLNVTGFLDGER